MTIEVVLLGIALAAAVPVAWGLLRRAPAAASREIAIYKAQLLDIEADLARGAIAKAEAQSLRLEAQRRLLQAARALEQTGVRMRDGSNGRLMAALCFLAALGMGAGLYLSQGRPDFADQPLAARATGPTMTQNDAELGALIERLEAQLAQNPDQVEGWQVLARAYVLREDFTRARIAWEQLLKRDANNAAAWLELAEAETILNGGQMNEAALRAADRARALGLATPKARYYFAMARRDRGDGPGALADWIALYRAFEKDAVRDARQAAVLARIHEMARMLNIELATHAPDIPTRPAIAPQIGVEAMDSIAALPPAEQRAAVRAMVERLAARLEADPSDASAWVRLVDAWGVLGDGAQAQAAMTRALVAHPDNKDLLIRAMQLAIQSGDDDAARDYARRLHVLLPPDGQVRLRSLMRDAGIDFAP